LHVVDVVVPVAALPLSIAADDINVGADASRYLAAQRFVTESCLLHEFTYSAVRCG